MDKRYLVENAVTLVEVAPRDGFQAIERPIPTNEKVAIIEGLIAAGVTRMELGSFVSPKAVPQMADMGEIATHFCDRTNLSLAVLVPNAKGAEIALRHGIEELIFVFSVSESHNQSNVRSSVDQSLQQLQAVVQTLGAKSGSRLRVDLATAFDCPFEGTVPLDQLRAAFDRAVAIAPYAEFALCDTTGRATPYEVRERYTTVMRDKPDHRAWAFHGHDTFGMGVANALFAFESGVRVFDTSAAGLGGCPFAPGATGNTATEDLVFAFQRGEIPTGIDLSALLQVADHIASLPGSSTGGHLRTVPRHRATA